MSAKALQTAEMQMPDPDEPGLEDPEALQSAFRVFAQLSDELTSSYAMLKTRVEHLTREVEQANRQRMLEIAEKERIASRLENLLQLLPGGVVVLNQQGNVSECNAAARELLGEPLLGQCWRDVINTRFSPRQDDGHEISLKDGRLLSLATRSLDDEPGQIILLTDQTETRKLQQHLSRNQRLSDMGKMVSSLAHQIRTPLSAAMLYAGHLNSSEISEEQVRRFSQKLMSRLGNMERQVKDMLIFARGDAVLDEKITVGVLFDELRTAADVLLKANAPAEWANEVDISQRIQCNRESLTGALLNLIENGLQSAGEDARLLISAELESDEAGDHEAGRGKRKGKQNGKWLRLTVADNGPGVDPNLIHRLTEAFFTTRAQGTGLGLAVAQVVAKAHQGRFFIESEQVTDSARISRRGFTTRAGFILPLLGPSEQHRTEAANEKYEEVYD